MLCAVHQPNFFPYLGFFHKLVHADVFVLYDTALYSRTGFHNRNRIKTAHGVKWLTVPVHVRRGQAIREALASDAEEVRSHLRTLEVNYRRAAFFDDVYPQLERAYAGAVPPTLVELNRRMFDAVCRMFGYCGRVVMTSELDIDLDLNASEALAAMVERVGATSYVSGPGGRGYLDEGVFRARGLEVVWQDFHHPIYDQLWGAFEPNLSVLDVLFNVGPSAARRLLQEAPLAAAGMASTSLA
ncbi:MAG TPA: WbqC family protein [Pirellulales bacterium]|nr:WbqC family protein [Pirellulales bacterium]